MAKLRVDKLVKGNAVWHEHQAEDIGDLDLSIYQLILAEGAFVDGDKTKLDGIADGAEVNVNADWNAVSGDAEILNKPTIPTNYLKDDADDNNNGNLLTLGSLGIDATIDHTISNSSDDLIFTNPNEDGKAFFNFNRGGTTGNLVEMDGNLGLFRVSAFGGDYGLAGLYNITGTMGMTSITGMVGMNPTLTGNGILVANLVQPTYTTGSSVTNIAFYMNPLPTGTAPLNIETIRTVATNHRVNVNDTIKIISEQGFNRAFFAFGADDTSVNTYTQIVLGGEASVGDFGFTAPTYLEEMITLQGGCSRPLGTTGSVTQKGLKFTGFGTGVTGLIGGTDSCYAMHANGGLFAHAYDYNPATYNALTFGASEDAGIGYNGTDLEIDTQLVGTGTLDLSSQTATAITTETLSEYVTIKIGGVAKKIAIVA